MYQVKKTSTSNNNKRIALVATTAVAAFIIVFMATTSVLTMVYGLETTANASMGVGAGAAVNGYTAAIGDGNPAIDNYVTLIKSEICWTLNNATAENECYNL